ncbi:MAG: translation initiation factor eIF-1A [Candidatus Aenigmatarchaeota archaeon]
MEERVRIPKNREILGTVEAKLGGKRVKVKCQDGFVRICRIPGRLGRELWLSVGDVVIIDPWIVQSDERGDVIWKYTKAQTEWLKRKGFLSSENSYKNKK